MTDNTEKRARDIMANNGGIDEVDDPKMFRDIVRALKDTREEVLREVDKILHDGQSEIDFDNDSEKEVLIKTGINVTINRLRNKVTHLKTLLDNPKEDE